MSVGGVAAAHPLCMEVGRRVLERGGNAYDATIAVSAALTVVQPHANGLGSDFFATIREGGVRCINGSGPAAALATPEFFEDAGLKSIPTYGSRSSLTVPGLVASWGALAADTTLPFPALLEPAIQLAAKGFPPSTSLRSAIDRTSSIGDEDWRLTYRHLLPADALVQADLARTLGTIAEDQGHGFYHGALARAIETDMETKGGLIRFEDLDEFQVERTAPISVKYRGYDVYTNPPNSQGATELIWLNLLGREDLAAPNEVDYVETLVRTMHLAWRYRSEFIGEPRELPFPVELLTADYPYRAEPIKPEGPGSGPDTTAFSVYDGTIGISAIQSNYMGFGSGHTVRGTGINLNNRGAYFTLERSHHNVLAPRKRTFHTLMTTLATGPSIILLGSMGGDVQPQSNVQILTRMIDRGEELQSAVAAPRFAYPASIYGDAPLYAEAGVRLRRPSTPLSDAERSLVGHAHGIRVGASVQVGIDPRGDGLLPIRHEAPR